MQGTIAILGPSPWDTMGGGGGGGGSVCPIITVYHEPLALMPNLLIAVPIKILLPISQALNGACCGCTITDIAIPGQL